MKLIVTVEKSDVGARVTAEIAFESDKDANPSKAETENIYAMGNFLCHAAQCFLETKSMTKEQMLVYIHAMARKPLVH
jgi:hypothetical protein